MVVLLLLAVLSSAVRSSLRQSELSADVLLCCGVKWQWKQHGPATSVIWALRTLVRSLEGILTSRHAHQQMDALCVDETEGGCDCVVVFLLSLV